MYNVGNHETHLLQLRIYELEQQIAQLKVAPLWTNDPNGLLKLAEYFLQVGKQCDSSAHEVAGLAIKNTAAKLKIYMG